MERNELNEILNKLKENLKKNIPNATRNEENYYLRGVIDAAVLIFNNEDQKS